jgi:uncharacterized membrane protein YbaN (DUF454 family)
MVRVALSLLGLACTGLAIAGAMLPGLPTTPFVLVALWAFARSSATFYQWLAGIPLLRTALAEARRFEAEGAVRLPVKATALACAWGSVLASAVVSGGRSPVLLSLLTVAAAGGTLFMWWVPTARE